MSGETEKFTIGALARAAGVGVETVRFYQRRGLLPEPGRPYGSVRRYGRVELGRLRFVRRSQQLGFTLDEIGELLRLEDGTHCDEARMLAESKLTDVRRKLEDLQRIRDTLTGFVDQCCVAQGNMTCPLIAGLQFGSEDPAASRSQRAGG